jgi:hypothetical protein
MKQTFRKELLSGKTLIAVRMDTMMLGKSAQDVLAGMRQKK